MTDADRLLNEILKIVNAGNTAEVKKRGTLIIVLEVKKKLKPWADEIGHQ